MEKKCNIFILGNSLTESVLAWKLSKSPSVDKLYCLASSPTLKEYCETVEIERDNFPKLLQFVEQKEIDWVYVGSYKHILSGLPEYFRENKRNVFSFQEKKSELLQRRKNVADLLSHYALVMPPSYIFDHYAQALQYICDHPLPFVIKTDNPALSSTSICKDQESGQDVLSATLKDPVYEEEDLRVLVEKFLPGPTISISALLDDHNILLLPYLQGRKSLEYGSALKGTWLSPAPQDKKNLQNLENSVLLPAVHAFHSALKQYEGPLVLDVILDKKSPYVVDARTHWDPLHLQALMHHLVSDPLDLFARFQAGTPLDEIELEWAKGGVLGFYVPLTLETSAYMKAFAQNQKRSLAPAPYSIQILEGKAEFPGSNFTSVSAITIGAPTCKEAISFFLSQWKAARLPEDAPLLHNILALDIKDW